jgi:flagellar hook-associated protein 3 FlgL
MRITDGAMFDTMKRNLGAARQQTVDAQQVASDGMRVRKPSDDPTAFAQARRLHARAALAKAGASAAAQAGDRLEAADGALNSANDAVSRARQLAIQGASGTLTAAERHDISEEVKQIRSQLLTLSNTQVDGHFVFAGNVDGAEPFASDGTFSGSATSRELEVFPGVRSQSVLTGGEAFGAGTGNDVFSSLQALSDALDANDTNAVRASITNIDVAYDRITNARAQAGSMMNSLDVARSVADRYGADAVDGTSKLIGADEVTAASDLMKASTAYNAALAAAQRLPLSGLIGQAR